MPDLVLHDLAPSPNNRKVRVALCFKGLAYERRPFWPGGVPGDRAALIAASNQPLTPVLEHGAVRMFDSAAILRYLEANFPDTPPLFSHDYAEMKEIERQETFARTALSEPIGAVFRQAFAPPPDAAAIRAANEALHELTARLEDRLAGDEFLVGGRMTAADVTAAPVVGLAALPEGAGEPDTIPRFFADHMRLGEGRERTAAWLARVLAYDA